MATTNIVDKADRITTIDQEVRQSTRTQQHNFRSQMTDLPVVRLEVGLPIYRIKNGRTSVEQRLYITDHDCDEGFFEGTEEDSSVQEAQFSILRKLAKDPKAPIYDELAHVAVQTEPLLLTSYGTVLNGNRRLAAMRELFNEDPDKYSSYSHVDAAILPKSAAEKDLELMEAELQLAPETRLAYGWIERRLKLRHQVRELRIDRGRIKASYRFKRDQDINIELSQLDLAEEYLSEFLNEPRAYEKVTNSAQLFRDLEKSLRGCKPDESESRRKLGFLLAKEAQNLGNRVYGFKSIFGKDFAKFAQKFAKRQGLALTKVDQATPETNDPEDPLGGLSGGSLSSGGLNYSEIVDTLSNPSATRELGDVVVEIAEQIRIEERDQSSGEAALKCAERVNSLLQEIDISKADASTFPGIVAQLATVIARAQSLKREVQNITNRSAEKTQ